MSDRTDSKAAYVPHPGEFDGVTVSRLGGGKRLGMEWNPWMGDWFTSWSPRNSNTNGEGPWAHWISLALMILQHPFTERLWPDLHAAVKGFENPHLYSETEPIGDLPEDIIAAALNAPSQEDDRG